MRLRGRLAALSLVIAGTVASVGPVQAADGQPSYLVASGRFGVVSLIDNPTYAGGICTYDPSDAQDLVRIKARRPIVFAYDRPGRKDVQLVGWRFFIEASDDLATWTTTYRSPLQKRTATDATNADFRPMQHALTSTHPYYRVRVRVFWYRNGKVDGEATLYPFFYGVVTNFEQYVPWYCPDPLV